MALSKLPRMFQIPELCKGHFPHLYNRKENQRKVLKHIPEPKYYNPDGMKSEDRKCFYEWYKDNKNSTFDLQKELLKYCRSDVDILRRCCLKFRELFMEMTSSVEGDPGMDPFEHCCTIALACNLVFRAKFSTIGNYRNHKASGLQAPSRDSQSRLSNGSICIRSTWACLSNMLGMAGRRK